MNQTVKATAIAIGAFLIPLFATDILPIENDLFGGRIKAWEQCDFSVIGGGQGQHVAMMGDSNGALFGADPYGAPPDTPTLSTGKYWEKFLEHKPPGGEWKVLNMAWSGSRSGELLGELEKCTVDGPGGDDTLKESYLNSTPNRTWIQIGGNDMLAESYHTILVESMPLLGHFWINKTLNDIGRIIEIHQRNGRSVLLVGYFPIRAKFAEDPGEVPTGDPDDFGESQLADTQDLINRIGDYLTTQWTGVRRFFTKVDVWLGGRFGRESLTGRSVSPSRFYNGRLFGDFIPSTNPLVRAFVGANLIAHFFGRPPIAPPPTHYGEVGWQLLQAVPNRQKMTSILVFYLGQRMAENKVAQATPISPTRSTVDYVDLSPHFMDPQVSFGGLGHLYSDHVHLNDEGFKVYGRIVSQKMLDLRYYEPVSAQEADFIRDNTKHWEPLPVAPPPPPPPDDTLLIIICFFYC